MPRGGGVYMLVFFLPHLQLLHLAPQCCGMHSQTLGRLKSVLCACQSLFDAVPFHLLDGILERKAGEIPYGLGKASRDGSATPLPAR
jgi:hypothetical protein